VIVREEASKQERKIRSEIEHAPAHMGERAGESERASERARKGGRGGVAERERGRCVRAMRWVSTLS
jgi:hypothetical protein